MGRRVCLGKARHVAELVSAGSERIRSLDQGQCRYRLAPCSRPSRNGHRRHALYGTGDAASAGNSQGSEVAASPNHGLPRLHSTPVSRCRRRRAAVELQERNADHCAVVHAAAVGERCRAASALAPATMRLSSGRHEPRIGAGAQRRADALDARRRSRVERVADGGQPDAEAGAHDRARARRAIG